MALTTLERGRASPAFRMDSRNGSPAFRTNNVRLHGSAVAYLRHVADLDDRARDRGRA